jgi:hypothetical protein
MDNFYMSTITPLFYVECLADLEKKISSHSTPESYHPSGLHMAKLVTVAEVSLTQPRFLADFRCKYMPPFDTSVLARKSKPAPDAALADSWATGRLVLHLLCSVVISQRVS